jgi:hypothetical protein
MPREIEHDEEIAREKWCLDGTQSASVSNSLMPLRLKGPEALAIELTLGAHLGKRQRVYRIPPFAISKVGR